MTDPQARLDELAQQVAADPGGPRYPALADALIGLGRYDEAVGVCQLGLANTPRDDGYRSLAEALLLLNRADEAFDAVEQALAGAHEDPRSLRLLGACHLAMGRPDLAQPVLERSARLDPSDMVTLDLLTRTAIQASGAGALAPEAAGAAPPADAAAPWDPGDGDQAWSFQGTDVLVDGSEAAPGELSLDLGGPPTAGAQDPGGADDLEPLELDLGGAPEAGVPGADPPGDPFLGFGQGPDLGGPAPGFDPAPGPPSASRPAAPSASRPAAPSSWPAPPQAPPAAPSSRPVPPSARPVPTGPRPPAPTPVDAARKRQLLIAGAAGAGVLLLVIAGFAIRGALHHRHLSAALATATAAYQHHDYAGYRNAQHALNRALALDPMNPKALGLDAFVSARLFADFAGGTEDLVRAQERLTDAERLPQEPPRALAARALLDLHAGRPGDVVLATGKGLAHDPGSLELQWIQARAEYELERPDLALSSLAALAKGGFLPAATSLAALQVRRHHPGKAAATLAAVLDTHPAYVPALTAYLAAAVSGHAKADAALAAVEKLGGKLAQVASPDEQCRIHLAQARLAVRAGRPADAAAAEDAARSVEAAPDCLADLGRELAWRGRPRAAAEVLATAADALDADAPERAARLRLAAVAAALDAGQSARAQEILAKAPPDADAKVLTARAQLADGHADLAARTLAPLLRHRRPPLAALAVGTDVALARGDAATARRDAARARRLARRDRADGARALLAVGQARSAAALASRALARDRAPGYGLLTLAGRAEVAAGHLDRGLGDLERALTMNPAAPGAVDAYLALAPPDRARTFLGKLPAPDGPALAALADLDAGDAAAAKADLQGAKGADTPRVAVARARLDAAHGEAGVLGRLEKLKDAHPADLDALVAFADAALAGGRIGDAADAYQKALHRDPGLIRPRVGLAVAQVLGAASDAGAAASATRDAETWVGRHGVSGPLAGRVHAARALACATISDGRCTRRALAEATRAAPHDARTLLLAGRALEQLGDYRAARARYQAASTLPGGTEGLLDLGRLAAAGHAPTAGAVAALKQFLESDPEGARAGEARQALAKLH